MKLLKSIIKTGSPFGLVMGLFVMLFFIPAIIFEGASAITYAIISAVVVAVLAGLLFGLLLSVFTMVQAKKFSSIKNEFAKEHDIIYDDGVNHVIYKEAVGGWLFLTAKGLYFIPHKYNIHKQEMSISNKSIKAISTYKSFGIINNGLLVKTKDGSIKKFIVNDANKWASVIEHSIINHNQFDV